MFPTLLVLITHLCDTHVCSCFVMCSSCGRCVCHVLVMCSSCARLACHVVIVCSLCLSYACHVLVMCLSHADGVLCGPLHTEAALKAFEDAVAAIKAQVSYNVLAKVITLSSSLSGRHHCVWWKGTHSQFSVFGDMFFFVC